MELNIGDGYKLRIWTLADVPSLAKYANNRNIWRNLRDGFPNPYTEDDAKAYIDLVSKRGVEHEWAIASSAEAIGGISLRFQADVHRKSAEIGYWLAEPFWNRGIMTRAVGTLLEFAFASFDLVRVYAAIFEWNPPSMRVLEKNGFTLEGRLRKSVFKDGRLIDSLMYGLVR